MDLNLTNRNVAITGGSRGIGKAIAEAFAAEKANISICARNKKDINNTIAGLEKFGKRYSGHTVDINNRKDVEKWLNATASELGGIDILILNAGALNPLWEPSLNVDVWGTINTVKAALPYLQRSSAGAITYIGSKAASVGIPGAEAYCAVKAAMTSYMKSLSQYLTKEGIRINTVSPGDTYFEGGYWDRIKKEDPEEFTRAVNSNGFKRMAKPEEIADCVVFISSPRASYISGANLLVDGASLKHVSL
jgi:3-oxoacyl-[acyl-carrier protein] reductase